MVEYQGNHGIVEIDGVAVAVGEFSVKFPRGVAAFSRSGKLSDLKLPGKIDCTGSLKRIMVDGSMLQKVLGAASAGSVTAIHLGMAPPTAGVDTIIQGSDLEAEDSASSRIKLTALAEDISAAGRIVLHGTDINDVEQTEIITIPATMSATDTIISVKVFKTIDYISLSDYAQVDGTMKVDAITGATSLSTLGVADYFTLKGKCSSGSNYIEVNLADCWFTEGGLAFTDANAIIEETLPFVVKDLDEGTSINYL